MARENASRNPKRTAATAAALMIGVSLVGFITVFAASGKASIRATVDEAMRADYVVSSDTGVSPDLARHIRDLPGVATVSSVRIGTVEIDGTTTHVAAVDPNTIEKVIKLDVADGDMGGLSSDGVAVHEETAKKRGWEVGDTIPVSYTRTGAQTLTVRALFSQSDQVGSSYLISTATYEQHFADQFDTTILATVDDGADPATVGSPIEQLVRSDFPAADVQDRTEYKQSQTAQIDPMLNLIYGLLFLAVVIALIGIANTLALSIFERTRELGLLRAVGMTRRQLRSTVRWESVIIALVGTTLGLGVGLFFSWTLVTALADDGFSRLVVPVRQLAVVVYVAALAGVLAAIGPARRAGRLDILRAIRAD